MDEVQRFIANNQHQFGYIMQEASRQWIAKDPVGALTVGDCNIVVQRHGEYNELLEKIALLQKMQDHYKERAEKAETLLEDIMHGLDPVKELKRLQGIEQALQDFDLPNGSAADVFAWLESTTGYLSEQD